MTNSAGQCVLRLFLSTMIFLLAFAGINSAAKTQRTAAQSSTPVTTVSAASFAATLAPDSIASAFGVNLATRVEIATSQPLPTNLAGTTVRVNGTLAPLFFVSPGQINYLIPPDTPAGAMSIVVNSGDGTVSTGTVQIVPVAPALFTANASGQGVLAAVALRVKADSQQVYEQVAQFDAISGSFRTKPIDPGPDGERVFLILFGTGLRRADETLRVVLGGNQASPIFFGATSGFSGLDQINVEIPRSLAGRGRVSVAVTALNANTSNQGEVEIAALSGPAPPQVSGYLPANALAGSMLTINGSGFSASRGDNLVRIGGSETRVISAAANQLSVIVPFGVETGLLSVRTSEGEGITSASVPVRTSISGFVEDTSRSPIAGVTVRLGGTNTVAISNNEGAFILPDVSPALSADVQIDTSTVQTTLRYPPVLLKIRVRKDRDNQIERPISLQAITGPSLAIGTSAGFSFSPDSFGPSATPRAIRTNGVTFEVPDNVSARFPDGSTRGILRLDTIDNSRTPVNLPSGVFSSTIAQITPFRTALNPGGKLTFPNLDGLPAGEQAILFRFDQNPVSETRGSFIPAGTAIVSGDGRTIETAAGAITETGYFFVAVVRKTTTAIGRVLEGDDKIPVRQALVRSRGQETFTDGNGSYILPNIPVSEGDQISVEASLLRPNGHVDRAQVSGIPVITSGNTPVPDLVLPSVANNQPPVVSGLPSNFTVTENKTSVLTFLAFDPDPGQTVQVASAGANFISVTPVAGNTGLFTLTASPQTNDAGIYNNVTVTATDNLGMPTEISFKLVVNRQPIANPQVVITEQGKPVAITLTGSDPENAPLSFSRGSLPAHGSLSGVEPNLTYTPAVNYFGPDSFTFSVYDGFADSAPAPVSIAVNPPPNRPPVLTVPGAQTVNAGQTLTFTVSATDPDTAQTLTLTGINLPAGAVFPQTSGPSPLSRQFSWTPNASQVGSHTVSFTVTDNGVPLVGDTKTVTISVVGQWTQTNGPNGGTIRALLINGSNLFAGTDRGGVFLSTNNGQSWTAVNNGLMNRDVRALAVSGSNLFAGTYGSGVFLSTNDGQSWTPVSNGLDNRLVCSLIVNEGNLFAGTSGGGIFLSTNNGASWTTANNGLTNQTVLTMTMSGNNLFAGTNGGGIFLSVNNGANWAAVNTGLSTLNVNVLTASGGNLFAGTSGRGVFISTNRGQSWTAGLTDQTVLALALSGSYLLAGTQGSGVFLSTDNGVSWTVINNGLTDQTIFALAASGGNIFAGAYYGGGVFHSTDNGQSWTAANNGLINQIVNTLTVSGSSLFAGTERGGVFLSTNNGMNWAAVNNGLPYRVIVNALVVSGSNLFAGTGDAGIFLSTDNGGRWTAVNNGLPRRSISALAVSGSNLFAATFGGGVYFSNNNGASWTAVNNGLTNQFVYTLAVNGSNLFAGTFRIDEFFSGVFLSTNNGTNWTPVNNGLPGNIVTAFAVSGSNIFAGTAGGGVFLSTNNGTNWTPVNNGLAGHFVVAFAVSGSNIFAGTSNGSEVFLSTNNGQSWTAVSNGLTNQPVYALAISGNRIFAGPVGNSVFVAQF